MNNATDSIDNAPTRPDTSESRRQTRVDLARRCIGATIGVASFVVATFNVRTHLGFGSSVAEIATSVYVLPLVIGGALSLLSVRYARIAWIQPTYGMVSGLISTWEGAPIQLSGFVLVFLAILYAWELGYLAKRSRVKVTLLMGSYIVCLVAGGIANMPGRWGTLLSSLAAATTLATIGWFVIVVRIRDSERRETELAERVASRTADLERALDAQRTLLAELHHRTKNNLQIVSSILSYEGETLASTPDGRRVEAAQDRIRALARLHELLYASTPTAKTELGYFLDRFIQELTGLVGHRGLTINPTISVDRTVPVDTAIRVALMINEIVLNTLEHAHAEGHGCSVDIAVTDDDSHISVVASDNGPGIAADVETRRGLGVELIGLLAKGLNGTATHDATAGVRWEISVPR